MQESCFFYALFSEVYDEACQDLRLEIRRRNEPGDDGKRTMTSAWYPLNDVGLLAAYKTGVCWKGKGDVYFGVLPRKGQSRGDANVPQAACLWVEIDGKAAGQQGALELLHASAVYEQFPPHIVVGSGGGVHCYWLLKERIFLPVTTCSQLSVVLKRMCFCLGNEHWGEGGMLYANDSAKPWADPVSTNAERILRVPGTTNHKRGAKVQIIETNGSAPRLTIAQWDAWLPQAPKVANVVPKSCVPGVFRPLPRRTKEAMEMSYGPGEMYPALRSILRSARGVGWGAVGLESLAAEFAMGNRGCERHVIEMLVSDTLKRISPD